MTFNKIACNFFPKTTVFIKFVVLLTIINDNPLFTIVNIIVNKIFVRSIVFKKQSYKKRSQIVLIKTIVFENETIV